MSISSSERDRQWASFVAGLTKRIEDVDLAGRDSTKFEVLAEWLAGEWELRPRSVVCKYVQHSKNRWNRLREALRRSPAAILLLFEGEDSGDIAKRVALSAAMCPSLAFVVVLLRAPGSVWRIDTVLYRKRASLPHALRPAKPDFRIIEFKAAYGPSPVIPTLAPSDEPDLKLADALELLGLQGGDPASPQRAAVAESLASLTGINVDSVGFKVIPSSKNLGNRLGEALGLAPAVLIVVCPELLEERVIEKVDLWPEATRAPLILVLCAEEIRIRIHGPVGPMADHLRIALGSGPPPSAAVVVSDAPSGELFDTQVASRAPDARWAEWSYEDWNEHLVRYSLLDDGHRLGPVERLAATPEELVLVAEATLEEAEDVAQSFVRVCVEKLPEGTSFCGFCRNHSRYLPSNNTWTSASPGSPPFFAMLWMTCLVAYGYPTARGGFYQRFYGLIGKSNFPRCLPEVWQEVRSWSQARSAAGDGVRELVLPPPDAYRTVVGFSHFLAFPHEQDRRLIARVLMDAELVGFEPPIRPVVTALQRQDDRFSRLFREDLDNFVADFVENQGDPRDSAFWRAVRQEALDPSYSSAGARERRKMTSILAIFDDVGLLPFLGCSADWTPPPGYSIRPLDNPIGDFEHYAVAGAGGLEEMVEVMFSSLALLGPGPRALINQGVLVFQEDQSDEFLLVSGHDISGSNTALIRDDLIPAFTDAFRGTAEPSRMSGWSEVTGCEVTPLDQLPDGLAGVVQLLRTMNPPTLRLVGGIQVTGGYLALEGFLPRIRAADAVKVQVVVDVDEYVCESITGGEWIVPPEVVRKAPCDLRVVATWPLGESGQRESQRIVRLRTTSLEDDFLPLVSGHYFLESCCPGQSQIQGGSPISLGITTGDSSETFDLLESDPSVRFLGPGLGEMSLEPRDGFDWLAVGPKSRPELLVFVGDDENPTPAADRRSPGSGDRRHWRAAFTKARAFYVRTQDGAYRELAEFPTVAQMKQVLGQHHPSGEAEPVSETRLETVATEPPHRSQPLSAVDSMADAIAALSVRRGGLRYRTVQELFAALTGLNDYVLHHELLRSWTECGALDLVRSQGYSATRLVARRPRFVAVPRGPLVEATLLGLITRSVAALVRRAAGGEGLSVREVQPGSPWQPSILRVRGELTAIEKISRTAGLEPVEWLPWERDGQVPARLEADVDSQGLWTGAPPAGFSPVKYWRWDTAEFRRGPGPGVDEVQVEQRVHPESGSIYVVVVDGDPWWWTYIRNWALLCAYEVSDRAPFRVDHRGWVMTSGRSPVHLPLPLGRLNAVLGEGAPGPIVDRTTGKVEGYCYPFGVRVTAQVAQVIPTPWLMKEVV